MNRKGRRDRRPFLLTFFSICIILKKTFLAEKTMNIEKWLKNNTCDLSGKTVAVTGSTGGLGRELCQYLAKLGATLILMDRNKERSERFAEELWDEYDVDVKCINVDLEDMDSVKLATDRLLLEDVDVFIHNAGAYSIPRHKCTTGLDNVFQINFVSPYYIVKRILPKLRQKKVRVVVVGSIAHNYSKADENDVDFSTRKQASKVYGNAKRYLMYSLIALFRDEREAKLAITHPGIAFTNITAHYPKLVFAIIKYPMKIIFMKPRRACLSILRGVFDHCEGREWIGPKLFDVWGMPKKKKLSTASEDEIAYISQKAEEIYKSL